MTNRSCLMFLSFVLLTASCSSNVVTNTPSTVEPSQVSSSVTDRKVNSVNNSNTVSNQNPVSPETDSQAKNLPQTENQINNNKPQTDNLPVVVPSSPTSSSAPTTISNESKLNYVSSSSQSSVSNNVNNTCYSDTPNGTYKYALTFYDQNNAQVNNAFFTTSDEQGNIYYTKNIFLQW